MSAFNPNIKVFNLEIKDPIDFENQLVIENIIRQNMLGHLNCPYNIQSISLSTNRKDNYVLVAVVELFID